jgi:histidine triad (HIT) family protein/ATP adenylyltransferase
VVTPKVGTAAWTDKPFSEHGLPSGLGLALAVVYPARVSHDPAARVAFDFEQYRRRVQQGPCFVCAFLAGHPDYRHHTLYEDDDVAAFLTRHPVQLGYCLVAPKRHVESWIDDMEETEFLRFQGVVRRVARAVAATVPTERMYSLSLGSQQGNAHVHWHLAALPPGVPYQQQQFYALMAENGVLPVDDTTQAALAQRIREHL